MFDEVVANFWPVRGVNIGCSCNVVISGKGIDFGYDEVDSMADFGVDGLPDKMVRSCLMR